MLTPAHPHKDDPLCKRKREQHRLDQADKKQRPGAWGFPGPEPEAASAAAPEDVTAKTPRER